MTDEQLQKEILVILHKERSQTFSQAIDSEDLAQRTGLPWNKIQRVVEYLEQSGYIESKDKQRGSRLYRTFHLTAKGIDLVEGRKKEGAVSVGGDYVQITVGDHAQNLALGKDIAQQQGITHRKKLAERLDSSLQELLAYLESDGKDLTDDEQVILVKHQISQLRESLVKIGLIQSE